MQAYSDPARESNPHALPDVEVFHVSQQAFIRFDEGSWQQELMVSDMVNHDRITAAADLAGWYWWSCFPDCLPDGDPSGPFKTEALALADAQSDAEGGAK